MAVSKCYLCNVRLRGGDGKYKELDGKARKVCVDERSCRLRREMKKKIAETADEEEKDDPAAVSYIGVTAIVLMELLAFGAGIIVGVLIC